MNGDRIDLHIDEKNISAAVAQVKNDPRKTISDFDKPCRCPNCGTIIEPFEGCSIKRGAVTVSAKPRTVTWRGHRVGLSPVQAEIFATIAKRGHASFKAIDQAMTAIGASPNTRSIHILRIRQKFAAIGAMDPLERIGRAGLRMVVEPDGLNSSSTVIGLRSER